MQARQTGWLVGIVNAYGAVEARRCPASGNATNHRTYWNPPPYDRWWYAPGQERVLWHDPPVEDSKFAVENFLRSEGYKFDFVHVINGADRKESDLRLGQWHGNPRNRRDD